MRFGQNIVLRAKVCLCINGTGLVSWWWQRGMNFVKFSLLKSPSQLKRQPVKQNKKSEISKS